jgi:hypothetical protein
MALWTFKKFKRFDLYFNNVPEKTKAVKKRVSQSVTLVPVPRVPVIPLFEQPLVESRDEDTQGRRRSKRIKTA